MGPMSLRRSIVPALIASCAAMSSVGLTAAAVQSQPATEKRARVQIKQLVDQPDAWFTSAEGQRAVRNIIAAQTVHGGWHKGYDATAATTEPAADARPSLAPPGDSASTWNAVATIDNDATYSELRILARAVRVTGSDDARASFARGIAFLFKAQYDNGGFPQRYPLQDNYGREITFNDDAMLGVMLLLRDVAAGKGDFAFVAADTRESASAAVAKAVDCLVKSQIRDGDTLTLWGQQHNEVTLAPSSARTYELPSACSSESAGLVLFLMDVPNPDERVKAAVEAAVAFFEKTKIEGFEYARLRGPQYEKGYERKLVADPSAPPLWARFYELNTRPPKPLFVDRDGTKHPDPTTLSYERRTGYAWYSTSPNKVLARYPKWKAAHGK